MMKPLVTETLPRVESDRGAAPSAAPWTHIAAAAIAIFYLATSIYISAHRLYWFDEIFIIRIAKLPDIGTMWKTLASAADTMPPGYHLMMRLWCHLFGYSEVATRLPSAIAMVVGLLVTFDCARRLTDGVNGLIALSLLTCSLLPYYGYEARPYAFFFMLSALAFWIWSCTNADSKLSAISFGVVLGLAVTMHYYAVLNIIPYAIWELSRWRPRRRPSLELIAGIVGIAVPMAVMWPLATAFSRQFSSNFWAHPSFYELRTVLPEMFPQGLFLLALIVMWVVLMGPSEDKDIVEGMQPAEAVGWLCLCIPLVGFAVAELKTKAFLPRYFVGALPGVAVAFACWVGRIFRQQTLRVSAGILLLLVGWGAINQWQTVRHPESIDPFGQQTALRRYLGLEASLEKDGKRFLLFNNSMLHLEATHYSRHPEEVILLLFPEGRNEIPTARVQENLGQYSPMQFWKLDDLKKHAAETALIDPTPETLEALKQAGIQVEVRFSKPMQVVYLR
jgi:hypothetical protein